jgi:putative hemolysin
MDTQRHGSLEVRLARGFEDVDAAQALRYRVFFDEMGAIPDAEAKAAGRDRDRFDPHCDHLVVIDHGTAGQPPKVVGTYRLLRRTVAARTNGFYSAGEFDLAPLWRHAGEVLELGRSCVDPAYRTGAVMPLLWRGIAGYIARHDIDILFGCASLPGVEPKAARPLLSYLYRNHLAPSDLRVRALASRYLAMADEPVAAEGDPIELPPLIKGYLRLSGWVGDGAVIDYDFNTIDVCIIVQTQKITAKYQRHYLGADRQPFVAAGQIAA